MAQMDTGGDSGGGGRHQKKRAKKASTHIDMTPMVDLGFLLLTFFVLTATFNKPSTMEIAMPIDDKNVDAPKVKHIVTFVVDKSDSLYYYYNELDTTSQTPYKYTTYDDKGVRKLLVDWNTKTINKVKVLEDSIKAIKGVSPAYLDSIAKRRRAYLKADKEALTVVIKTYDDAKYKRVIDLIDEMSIVQVGKYALVDMSDSEKGLLIQQKELQKK